MMRPRFDLVFYGDDLTGSTDALEALSLAGVPTRLFLELPTNAEIAALDGVRAVGVAGGSRAMSPAWMDAHLPSVFKALQALRAPIVHYKVCSTFDSGSEIGNIGRVLEIGLEVFGCGVVPIVVGAPRLGRYTAFGQLFATAFGQAEAHRIDRHPVMSRHPKTPMREADLLRHLAMQTALPLGRIDFRALLDGSASKRFVEEKDKGSRGVFLDILDERTSAAVGHLLKSRPWGGPTGFVIGSSGVEYALLDADPSTAATAFPPAKAVDQLLVVSGSCSPTTEAQIAYAEAAGWLIIDLDPSALLEERRRQQTIAESVRNVTAALSSRRSVVVATARGPDDRRLAATALMCGDMDTAQLFGGVLGAIAREALTYVNEARRVVIAGGDTSSVVGRTIGVRAMDMAAPLVPGAPLCRVVSGASTMLGRELVLKGGQVGGADYFERTRLGTNAEGRVDRAEQSGPLRWIGSSPKAGVMDPGRRANGAEPL